MNTRRKMAIATWSAPREGNIHGKMTVDIDNALAYIESLRARSGARVTLTHLIGKAVGYALAQVPHINSRIVFGHTVPHASVDVSFLVAAANGADLAKVKVTGINRKPLPQVAAELREETSRIRSGRNPFNKSKPWLRFLPTWLLRPTLSLLGYLTGVLGINLPALGVEAFPFGVCVITNIGSLGIEEGYVPATPFAHVPLYVAITTVKSRPVVRDGRVVIRRQLDLMATIDHRVVDGYQIGQLAKHVREALDHPHMLESDANPRK
ncbi:MAG: 2-oxo acid dehydrogenase subunit E2 [Myxococcota bacterium]